MAQYFEVLSQNDGSLDQTHQFFNGNQENERTQVRYILADDTAQFQTQQLILSADQVMVLDSSQQQIQGVVIDQGHTYQTTSQQQFGTVVQNTSMNNQPAQQIFYMDSNNAQGGETAQAVQSIIEQAANQNPTVPAQPQPIVLNHQMNSNSVNANMANRQVLQGTSPAQRPVVQIRTPVRQGNIQVNQQPRPLTSPMRPALPQQVRPHQSSPHPMRSLPSQQVQMRLRPTAPQIRQPVQQQLQQQGARPPPPLNQLQQAKNQLASLNRQLSALQQQKQQQLQQQAQQTPQVVQQPQQSQQAAQQPQQSQQVAQQPHQSQQAAQQQQQAPQQVVQEQRTCGRSFQQQQRLKISQEQEINPVPHQTISIGKQIIKPLSEFRPFSAKDNDVEELDDHDPAMNSTPGQMANYKKLLEQRQQIGKNPILARLPSNIKITQTPINHPPPAPAPPPAQTQKQSSVSQTIDQVVSQVSQQSQQQPVVAVPQQPQASPIPSPTSALPHMVQSPQVAPKKPRAPPRSRNPPGTPKTPGTTGRQRIQRTPVAQQQPFTGPKVAVPQQPPPGPRFQLNQQQPRFTNQQQLMQQQRTQLQQAQTAPSQPPQPVPHPSQQPPPQQHAPSIQQNGMSTAGVNQSQMNYLITPPTPNRPRQQHPLPAYIPSSQIQQIIENTPIAEEFSDSIRMLVLLENGEQRLITFTLPKEACTIQEILEQVNVPFTPETNIQVTEANTNGINYIVTVGNVSNFGYSNTNEEEQQEPSEGEAQQQQQMATLQSTQQMQQNIGRPPYVQKSSPLGQLTPSLPPPLPEPTKSVTPELPKLIPGKLAVCSYCGYTGEDFNRCRRCTTKLPDNVKSIEAPVKPADLLKAATSDIMKPLLNSNSSTAAHLLSTQMKPNANPTNSAPPNTSQLSKQEPGSKPPSPTKKKSSKAKPVENESAVVISSDEEEDDKKQARSVRVSEQLLNKLGASISISPVTKEPSLSEIKKHVRKLSAEPTKCLKLPLKCRTVRIGSYRFVPCDDVILDSKCLIIKAPVVDNTSEIKTIRIDRGDIVKVLICFNKALPVIFYYLNVGAAPIIRDMLNLTPESGLYFNPIDEKEDSYRKITLLPDDILDDYKPLLQQLYGIAPYNIIDELTGKEANDILIKACPKDSSTSGVGSFSEIKQILMYPKDGQGRLSINTEDYVCLAVDQFLNDKIIDFYLKYLWENLPDEQREKVHMFSTFFYKRLTTKPTKAAKKSHPFESDSTLTAAEKRHWRVRTWTKRINLFEKDFIVVPINENAHWFLAIICFPGMRGAQTFDGKPYIPEPKPSRKKNKQTPEVKKEKPIPCDEPLLSDKDEAESEDSDMESDDSEESAAAAAATAAAAAAAVAAAAAAAVTPAKPQPRGRNAPRIPIKQPCILIFDSLAGPSRSRVVATLRDYLTVEFKVKMDTERVFDKDVIKGASCKVPQQNNFTDCGLYLLQYVEQFFKDPIKDYHIPMRGINEWFEEIVVTKKREDICNLLKELMIESGTDVKILPDIALPTLNGKVIERQEADHEHEAGEEEQEDMFTDIEDSEMTDTSSLNTSRVSEGNGACKGEDCQENSSGGENSSHGSFQSSPMKPSDNSIGEQSEILTTVVQPAGLKPTLSEFPRQTSNKDTLNYLKSKRIVRHKSHPEGPEYKKTKLDSN